MSTSLAEQLRRLRAPQTSILIDSKKRASILFDPKEAANKDRSTIFELGYGGLMDLAALNSAFLQFEKTLFDRSTIQFERSVESSDVNRQLDKTIRRFFYYLSPYVMLQPAHMCLEWLIRRYHIHQFNRNEMMQLIFPYHETKIFVRCIRAMRLKSVQDTWKWLLPIQRSGVPLSKSAVLTRASRDPAFLKFVCKSTVEAIKELDTQASSLQAQIGFYCTTVIGALEYARGIDEWHISTILSSILKGLSSKVLDFAAAAYMISAQLVAKTQLANKLLDAMIGKVCRVEHRDLQKNAVTLLVLIFQNQHGIRQFPDESLVALVEHEWLSAAIDALVQQGIIVGPFCQSVIGACLQRVQNQEAGWQKCCSFLENFLLVVQLRTNDAQSLVKCTLDNYTQKKKPAKSGDMVIEIDSEDDGDASMLDKDVQAWYSKVLQSLERQYPTEFESTLKETMQSKSGVSESRRIALKAALVFRLKSTYTDDNVAIYENLYHYDARNRAEAVRFLVKNFEKMSIAQQEDGLLKDSLLDRLSDDDPKVLGEILELTTELLMKTLGAQALTAKLIEILRKRRRKSEKWLKVSGKVLSHLLKSDLWSGEAVQKSKVLLAVLPMLFPSGDEEVVLTKQILSSEFGKSIPTFKALLGMVNNANDTEKIAEMVEETLLGSAAITTAESLLEAFIDSKDSSWFLFLLRAVCPKEMDPSTGQRIFEAMLKILKENQPRLLDSGTKWYRNAQPCSLQLFLNTLKTLADSTKLSGGSFYSIDEQSLLLRIFELLLTRAFTSVPASGKIEYTESLKCLMNSAFPEIKAKLNFLAGYFILDHIRFGDEDLDIQLRAMKLFCVAAEQADGIFVNPESFLKMLIALTSPVDFIREIALDAFGVVLKRNLVEQKYENVVRLVVERSEEIRLDHEQFPLIFFTITSKLRTGKVSVLDDILLIATDPTVNNVLKSGALNIVKHVNNSNMLKRIVKLGEEMLKYAKTLEDTDNCIVLDKHSSKILRLIVLRIELATIKVLNEDETAWNFVQKLLEACRVQIQLEDDSHIALASIVMDAFFEELYDKLIEARKQKLLELVIEALTFGSDNSLVTSGNKLFKRISLNAKHVAGILTQMAVVCGTARGKGKATIAGLEFFNNANWKRGVTLLEQLQNKRKLDNGQILVAPLIDLMKKCLEFEEQSTFEYAKQLILSTLLLCSQKLMHDQVALKSLPENAFRIDLIVQCIRATQNPQTHHHALLLLCQCATLFPQEVLHNIMGIFTFMGSSVVRHDDAFSFQIINKIIESIVPTLVSGPANDRVVPVLKVFSDIVLDVPEHRRLALYSKLLRTLNADKHLWMFLCVLLESHVNHDEKEKHQRQRYTKAGVASDIPKRVEFGLQLIKDFDVRTALTTCIRLFEYLHDLPLDKDVATEGKPMDVDSSESVLFDLAGHSAKQLRHFKYVIVQIISNFTSSPEFIGQIAALDEEESKAMKPFYQEFIIKILCYVPQVTRAMERNLDTNQLQYWKVMLHHCYDVLENAISLLSPDMLLVVVHGLMQHKLATVQKKVIEILIAKLQHKGDYFTNCNQEYLLNLLPPLNDILDSILDKDAAAPTNEIVFIQQIALIALKLLSRVMGLKHIEPFKEVLQKLTRILKKRNMVSKIILATVVLAITEISSNLKAQAISQLSKFMPYVIEVLQDQAEYLTRNATDNVTIAIVTGIQKLFDSLPLFLGSYMADVLISLTTLWVRLTRYSDEPRTNVVFEKLQAIWSRIATTIPLRVVVPICDKTYRKLVEEQDYNEIGYVVRLLNECFEKASSEDIQNMKTELTDFYLNALEFRANNARQMTSKALLKVEESIVESFVSLVLKLSESSFRPLYQKLYDWSLRKSEEKERALTFFIVSGKIAEALKSLFVLFASSFIKDAADLLDKCNSTKVQGDLYFTDNDRNKLLIENILKTLYQIFLHDSKDFINEHRFDMLMQPIVDQLQNELVLEDDRLCGLLRSCVAQLANTVRNDTLWKQLNYQVLLKTRSNSPEIRINSLNCCVEIARKLGEQFVPLLPETVPFIAELFEDENEEVEKSCKRGVQEMEKTLGVSMQEYF